MLALIVKRRLLLVRVGKALSVKSRLRNGSKELIIVLGRLAPEALPRMELGPLPVLMAQLQWGRKAGLK
jgi:hypothetical protein